MSIHLEFGLKGYAVLVLKLRSASNAPSYVNLAIPPSHVVAFLAICQVVTTLWLLLQALWRWRTGCSGTHIPLSNTILKSLSSVLETMKRNFINLFFKHAGPIQTDKPKQEKADYNTQLQSPLLSLPAEIRIMIYRRLLLSTNPDHKIHSPDFLVSAKRRCLLLPQGVPQIQYSSSYNDGRERSGTHAALLRTCRKVYDEAIEVLYGENVFAFEDVNGIEVFRGEGLGTVCDEQQGTSTPLFNLQPNPQGRCAMIKHLALRFGHNDGGVFASSAAYYVPKQHHEGPSWAKFIHNVGYERGSEEICFTALDTLQLDFGYWEIGAVGRDRLLWVRPFIDRFRSPDGLSKLTIAGIDDWQTLEALDHGLLKVGGTLSFY